jgi:hypothetical protein
MSRFSQECMQPIATVENVLLKSAKGLPFEVDLRAVI